MLKRAFAARKALHVEDAGNANAIPLHDLFRGKLLTTFVISGPSAFIAIALSYLVQFASKNGWVGFITMFALMFIVTSAAYQLMWWIDMRKVYIRSFKNPWDRFLALEQDMIPVHWTGLRLGLSLGLVSTVVVGSIVVGALQLWAPKLFEVFPTQLVVVVLDFIFVQGPFMRIMGDFFEKHSHTLEARYQPILRPVTEPVS